MTPLRFAPYNREVIVMDRWRIPYASYGWLSLIRRRM